ncbi:MAG: hypothetical protein K1Y36_14930 [Blastocatellia bacterium]|nr:hypothetical protein [Blastocatellia bacterium]
MQRSLPRLQTVFLIGLCLLGTLMAGTVSARGQGSVGTGRLPRTTAEIRRTLKTVLVVKEIKPDLLTFTAKDEITNDELTYKVSRSAKITAEKGFLEGILKGKKELQLSDLQPGQRLEVAYRESLPTQITSIKVLKPKS